MRVYIDNDPATKGKKGGFAVGGYDITKGEITNFLNVATDTVGIINPSQNRLLWYPQKNAFLTGKVLVEKSDSVGINSFASGFESKAIGDWSQALGYKASARGNYSTAIGNNTNADSHNSFAFGNEAKVTGSDSYAFGTGAIASGISSFALGSSRFNDTTDVTDHTVASANYAFALGFGSAASSDGAFAMGVLDSASGPGSLSMGYFNRSRGWFSTTLGAGNIVMNAGFQGFATGIWTKAGNWCASSFGDRTYASGHTSFATGFMTKASGHLSATFGDNTIAPSWGSFAIGKFNAYSGSPEGWNSGDPIFMVGIGSSNSDRRNALTVYKNGITEFNKGTVIDYDRMELNSSGTGNRYSYIDFHSDNTYTDYSFRIFRNSGLNGSTDFAHRGTGNLNLITYENSSIAFTTWGAERMRIRGYNGFVGINTTYPTFQLDVAGSININKGVSGVGALFVNGNETIWYDGTTFSWGFAGSYNVFAGHVSVATTATSGYALYVAGSGWASGSFINGSDIRWKKNINYLGNVLDKVSQLKGVSYEWKQNEYPDMHFESGTQIGLIAQDVEQVFPELVKTDEKGYKGVDYEKLTVVLLESIKEQQSKIDRLEKEIFEIREKIASSSRHRSLYH
ncbi:MAG: tail fiber domain-containing protein [Bacteroidales bacterium]|nr:tail fiber domain-containing protein [Bacteroidales bacterium]